MTGLPVGLDMTDCARRIPSGVDAGRVIALAQQAEPAVVLALLQQAREQGE